MGIISVRLDDGIEARLKQEAKAQGRRLSDFLRERLAGEAANLTDPGLEKRMENVEKALWQLAEGIEQAGRKQSKEGFFTRLLILHVLHVLLPDLEKEEIWDVFRNAEAEVKRHWKRKEGSPS